MPPAPPTQTCLVSVAATAMSSVWLKPFIVLQVAPPSVVRRAVPAPTAQPHCAPPQATAVRRSPGPR